MPWTREKPYVLHSYKTAQDLDELFHATEAEQIEQFEKDKKSPFYIRVSRIIGKSPDQYTWEILEEWAPD